MLIDAILILAILVSGGYILYVVIRKLPVIARINVKGLPDVGQYRIKRKILEERLKRDIQKRWTSFYDSFIHDRHKNSSRFFSSLYERLKDWEQEYRTAREDDLATGLNRAHSRDELIMRAREAITQKQLSRAEKILIDTLKLDEHNVLAYMLLVQVYREQELFNQAHETLQFLEHITEGKDPLVFAEVAQLAWDRGDMHGALEGYTRAAALDPSQYKYQLDLASVQESLGDHTKARKAAEKALQMAPNNPKILDFLIENCIILQDKNRASDYLARLIEVNPQNGKIKTFRKRIAALS